MRHAIRGLIASAALAVCAPFASATVLTFDNLVGADGYASVPANYGGLDWSAEGWSVFTGAQYPFTAHSGDGRVTTGWGSDDSASLIRFLTPTVFDGAWFAGYEEVSVTFQMFLNGNLVATSSTLGLSDVSSFLSSGWSGAIDSVLVSSAYQANYVMDDFTFHAPNQIPEPGTLALSLLGLAFVAHAARRRNR